MTDPSPGKKILLCAHNCKCDHCTSEHAGLGLINQPFSSQTEEGQPMEVLSRPEAVFGHITLHLKVEVISSALSELEVSGCKINTVDGGLKLDNTTEQDTGAPKHLKDKDSGIWDDASQNEDPLACIVSLTPRKQGKRSLDEVLTDNDGQSKRKRLEELETASGTEIEKNAAKEKDCDSVQHHVNDEDSRADASVEPSEPGLEEPSHKDAVMNDARRAEYRIGLTLAENTMGSEDPGEMKVVDKSAEALVVEIGKGGGSATLSPTDGKIGSSVEVSSSKEHAERNAVSVCPSPARRSKEVTSTSGSPSCAVAKSIEKVEVLPKAEPDVASSAKEENCDDFGKLPAQDGGSQPDRKSTALPTVEASCPVIDVEDVKVCDICGDAGFEEMLVVCADCNDGAEHLYCMQNILRAMPEGDWFCEGCKQKKATESKADVTTANGTKSNNVSLLSKAREGTQGRAVVRVENRKVIHERRGMMKGSALNSKRAAEEPVSACLKLQADTAGTQQQPPSTVKGALLRDGSFKVPETKKVKFLPPVVAGASSASATPTVKKPSSLASPRMPLLQTSASKSRNSTSHGDMSTEGSLAGKGNSSITPRGTSWSNASPPATNVGKVAPPSTKEYPSFLLSRSGSFSKLQTTTKSGKEASDISRDSVAQKTSQNKSKAGLNSSLEAKVWPDTPRPRASTNVDSTNKTGLLSSDENTSAKETKDILPTSTAQCASQIDGSEPLTSTLTTDFGNAVADLAVPAAGSATASLETPPLPPPPPPASVTISSNAVELQTKKLSPKGNDNEQTAKLGLSSKDMHRSLSMKEQSKAAGNQGGVGRLSNTSELGQNFKEEDRMEKEPSSSTRKPDPERPWPKPLSSVLSECDVISDPRRGDRALQVDTSIQIKSPAEDLEKVSAEFSSHWPPGGNHGPQGRQQVPRSVPGFLPSAGNTRCYKCKELGHSAQSCTNRSSNGILPDIGQARTVDMWSGSEKSSEGSLTNATNANTKSGQRIYESDAKDMVGKKSSTWKDFEAINYVDQEIKPTDDSMSVARESSSLLAVPSGTSTYNDVNLPGKHVPQSHIKESSALVNDDSKQIKDEITVPIIAEPAAKPSKNAVLMPGNTATVPQPSKLSPSWRLPGQPSTSGDVRLDVEAVRLALTPTVVAVPKAEFLWRGCFDVNSSGSIVPYDGMQANPSTKASPRVYEASQSLPSRLTLEEVVRGDSESWPMRFTKTPPNEQDIALYFFPIEMESYERYYRRLLDRMIEHDLVLRGFVDGAELLIFASSLLPKKIQRWNMHLYLWGVFRGKRPPSVEPPGSGQASLSIAVQHQWPISQQPLHGDSAGNQLQGHLSGPIKELARNDSGLVPSLGKVHQLGIQFTGEEDMEVDMEGGKEMGVVELPVAKSDKLEGFLQLPPPPPLPLDLQIVEMEKKHNGKIENFRTGAEIDKLDLPPGFALPSRLPNLAPCVDINREEKTNIPRMQDTCMGEPKTSQNRMESGTSRLKPEVSLVDHSKLPVNHEQSMANLIPSPKDRKQEGADLQSPTYHNEREKEREVDAEKVGSRSWLKDKGNERDYPARSHRDKLKERDRRDKEGRERFRERDWIRDRDRERSYDRSRDRHRERDRDKDRERDRDKDRERDRDKDRERDRVWNRDRDRDREKEWERDRDKEWDRDRKRDRTDRDKLKDYHKETKQHKRYRRSRSRSGSPSRRNDKSFSRSPPRKKEKSKSPRRWHSSTKYQMQNRSRSVTGSPESNNGRYSARSRQSAERRPESQSERITESQGKSQNESLIQSKSPDGTTVTAMHSENMGHDSVVSSQEVTETASKRIPFGQQLQASGISTVAEHHLFPVVPMLDVSHDSPQPSTWRTIAHKSNTECRLPVLEKRHELPIDCWRRQEESSPDLKLALGDSFGLTSPSSPQALPLFVERPQSLDLHPSTENNHATKGKVRSTPFWNLGYDKSSLGLSLAIPQSKKDSGLDSEENDNPKCEDLNVALSLSLS